jgi:hypothetical protein
MSELTVDRLRTMLGRETNRAAAAERRERDLACEVSKLRIRIAELESMKGRPR